MAHNHMGIWLLSIALAGTVGCAGAKFSKVENEDTHGIRYSLPATYVLVKPDYDKGTASVSFWSGPDVSQAYAVDPYAYAASNTTDIQFTNGMLSQVTSDADSTKIASETISALSEVAKSVLTNAAKAAELAAAARVRMPGETPAPAPPVFLYMATREGLTQLYPK